jgi:hypothetical protein
MDLAVQAHRDGQFGQAPEAVVHGTDVVDDLDDVVRPLRVEDLRFGREEVLERALRSLDLAGAPPPCART